MHICILVLSFRWRMSIRKALSPSHKATSTTDVEPESKVNEDEKMLNEMEELTYAMDRKKKRAKKLLAKRQAKVHSLYLWLPLPLFLACTNL